MQEKNARKAYVVAIDMGYGHQRAAYALKDIAQGNTIINAGSYPGIPESDKQIWHESRLLYETVSKFRDVPVLGDLVFGIFDKFQAIKEFYPKTQGIEPPTLQLKQIYGLIKKRNWGKHLIEKLNKSLPTGKQALPLIATFPAIAFMAEYWGYKGTIWLVVTDADISRAWAPLNAAKTKICYCASTRVAAERLSRYGVPTRNIFLTGFPLPPQLTLEAKKTVARRLRVLDPQQRYLKLYSDVVKRYVGEIPTKPKKMPSVSITFAVGGAGAQEKIGEQIIRSLAPLLLQKKAVLNLVAGTKENIAVAFAKAIKKEHLGALLKDSLNIVYAESFSKYVTLYNACIKKTDILWTKPSELVFFAGLGLPILMAPPLGSQENENRKWLLSVGAGFDEHDPRLTRQWLLDFLSQGLFAEAAMQGFVEIGSNGVENIKKAVFNT